jgi:mediator of RNA polymerase II transcription subunit 5
MHFTNVNELLSTAQLPLNVRGALDTFQVSLSLSIGDGAKVAREQQLMQTMQLATGKGDIMGPNSETDIVSCSLALQNLVGINHDLPSKL